MNYLLLAAVVAAVSLGSCSAPAEEAHAAEPSEEYTYQRADSLPQKYLQELGNIRIAMEESGKMYQAMAASGYAFSESLLIPQAAARPAGTSEQQALILGSLSSDIMCAAAFGQSQHGMNNIEHILRIADNMGLPGTFDKAIMVQLLEADASANKTALITKAYMKADRQLYADERARLAVLMAVGGWLQGVCISSSMLAAGVKSDDVKRGAWNQVYSYANVKNMLHAFPGDQRFGSILEKLKPCEGPMSVVWNSNGHYTEDQAQKIAEAAMAARKDIIGV